MYHRSAVMREQLQVVCRAKDVMCQFPKRVDGTRWVGHTLTALKSLLGANRLSCYVGHLEEVSASTASHKNAAKG